MNFITKIAFAQLAISPNSVKNNAGYINSSCTDLLHQLNKVPIAAKDGAHFLRTGLKCDEHGKCLSRSNEGTLSLARILPLDIDKGINVKGEILESGPDPIEVSNILRIHNIAHIIYGSYSYYEKNINRFRIILITDKDYTEAQLSSTVEYALCLINSGLNAVLIADVKENHTWSQPWFFPRKPANCDVQPLYIEYLEGDPIPVCEPIIYTGDEELQREKYSQGNGEISPIKSFNEQNLLSALFEKYGYRRAYVGKNYEKWISPYSKSGMPGITVWDNMRFYSHHGSCPFNDNKSHDAFDLMKNHENLSESEAVIRAAKTTRAPDGRTIDEHNKSLANYKKFSPEQTPIAHAEILNKLLNIIKPVSFRKLAGLEDEEKITLTQYHVMVIDKIIELAKNYDWGMRRNNEFIYLYNGCYWNIVNSDDMKKFLGDAAFKMGIINFISKHFTFMNNLFDQFLAVAYLPPPTKHKKIVLINLKNGTFEIKSNGATQLRPFAREDFLTYQLPFNYDPDAISPLFDTYLSKVLPDKQLQNILAEYLGYVFISSQTLKLEKTLMLFGKGANGKSVFYEIVRKLLGEENTSEYSLQTLTNESGYQRAMIANKLVNYSSEINGRLEASIFKQLVSGEPVEARLPYGKPFIIYDYAKFIFNCNELPKDVEQSEAYFRRFLIVPFNVTIPENEQDKELASKIIDNELSGIFNWVLKGLHRLLKQKRFTDSQAVVEARAQYEQESDTVKLFLDEEGYDKHPTNYKKLQLLYADYRIFCTNGGFKPVHIGNFSKRLMNIGIVVERKNSGRVVYVCKETLN